MNPNICLIPSDYWMGYNTLELEYPWLTPEAIQVLVYFLKPHHEVLEFGSGGSTLFFARRASSVISFETLPDWFVKVREVLKTKGVSNVSLHPGSTIEECSRVVGDKLFDVALVDCVELSRLDAAKLALERVKSGGIIIVDNYDAPYCAGIDDLFRGKLRNTFDDCHWAGKGTRVYYC